MGVHRLDADNIVHLTSAGWATVVGAFTIVGGTVWQWFGENHETIGAITQVIGSLGVLTGMYMAIFRKADRDEQRWREHFKRHPEDLDK